MQNTAEEYIKGLKSWFTTTISLDANFTKKRGSKVRVQHKKIMAKKRGYKERVQKKKILMKSCFLIAISKGKKFN